MILDWQRPHTLAENWFSSTNFEPRVHDTEPEIYLAI